MRLVKKSQVNTGQSEIGNLQLLNTTTKATLVDAINELQAGGGGGIVTNPITFNNSGTGATSGITFDGSSPITISWNTTGAQKALTYSNGLTQSSTTLKLGGLLTAATTIDCSSTFHFLFQFTNGDIKVNGLTIGKGNNFDNSNTALGSGVFPANTTNGAGNLTGVGSSALNGNTTGTNNTGIGGQSLGAITDGTGNTGVGSFSMNANVHGIGNTSIGDHSLDQYTAGNFNTALGASAGGSTNASGSGNLFLGYSAGQGETGSNKLYIANASGTPLIGGDFTAGTITINGTISSKGYTVATLPTPSIGMRAYVTDATTPTYNGALTGGGTVKIPVFYNGTIWVSA